MDLRQLRYFTAIVEHGSFSKAASRLRVAQPALSQHLRHMEDELGVKLLHRGARGVLPTDAGERLMRHAETILAEFAVIRDSVRGQEHAPAGEVRFGMPGTVSEHLSVPLIEAARERYPAVRIRIAEAMSGFILDWLRQGAIDLAMIYATADPKGLIVHHGLTEELCLFGVPDLTALGRPPGTAVRLEEAAALDLILPGPAHGLRELIEVAAQAVGAVTRPAIEIDSYAQIKRLAGRGHGYGILPRMAVQQEEASGAFVTWPLTDPPLFRKVHLAYVAERPLSAACRAVGQLAWDILRRLVENGTWSATLGEESQAPKLYG